MNEGPGNDLCKGKSFINFFRVDLYQHSGFRMKFTFKAIFLLVLIFYVSSCQNKILISMI